MTNPQAKAVEAAVRSWNREDGTQIHAMSVAITAYLAAMRAEGWVMVRDVGKDNTTDAASDYNRGERDGWNACRAIMLGGAGDEQG